MKKFGFPRKTNAMSKRIIGILPQSSQYGVLHHFTRKVADAFARLGYGAKVMDYDESLRCCAKEKPDFTFGFNGAPMTSGGFFLADLIDVPHYAFLVDSPYYYLNLLQSNLVQVCCDDAADLELLRSRWAYRAKFFTQGVEPELKGEQGGDREYGVVFFASYFDLEEARKEWKRRFSPELVRVMDQAVERALLLEDLSLIEAFYTSLEGKLGLIEGVPVAELFYWMSYMHKGMARTELLKAFKELPVHVWDRRWTALAEEGSHLIIHDAVDYERSLDILKRSKVVLCNSVRSTRGCNERVLIALACGAVPVTNANPFFREHFIEGEELLLYHPGTMEKTVEEVRNLLTQEDQRDAMAEAGRRNVMQNHTWDSRVKLI